jgi:aminoglycoside phosphotransferase family enzyme/predicted kinase
VANAALMQVSLAATMNLNALIGLLSNPNSYPAPAGELQICQTHISVVILTAQHAFKIKKPVNLGFLDFSTLEKRRHFCEEEVRLNRRLAPTVYLGVVPVTAAGVEAAGEPLEYAVKMRRLPDEATLQKRVLRREIDGTIVERLARRLAAFHAAAARGAHIASFGRFPVVAGNARENFAQAQAAIGTTVHPAVFERLRFLTDTHLTQLQPLIDARADQGIPCDTHGDLHLDHIYFFPERPPPDDLVIIDCIEFNERFRYADPVADAAFVRMDLKFHGRRDLASAFLSAYLEASGFRDISMLFRFYSAYRAVVRAKVEGIKASEKEVPPEERQQALARSQAHWLLALGELEPASGFPCLVLIAGLPGAGKSTLARKLCARGRFHLLQTDQVRKELAGALQGDSIYSPPWNDRTYATCLRRAEEQLFQGKSVLVDANFRADAQRRQFLECALRWCVPATLILCKLDDDVARQRLTGRRSDLSDADWSIRQRLAAEWEPLGPFSRQFAVELDANQSLDVMSAQAVSAIESLWF